MKREANHAISDGRSPGRPGFVIVAVLIVVVVLALAAYQFTDLMSREYTAAVRTNSSAQARHAAVSGVHYAAAMLADPDSFQTDLGGDPFSDGAFADQEVRPGTGRQSASFSLVAAVPTGDGGYEQRYGAVTDEAAKLNINALIQLDATGEKLYAALMLLPNMTPDVADAIVDWVDADDTPRASGAESSTYSGLANPYQAKNGPLNSLDELLLVRGVTPQLLYGTDRNRNGLADDGDGTLDRGWSEYLTVYGRELNLDGTGTLRENVNESEDLPALYDRLTTRVGPELADYILAYKMFSVSTPTTTTATLSTGGGTMTLQVTGGTGATGATGTAADLSTAVQAALAAESPTNKRRIKSLLDLRNSQVTLPKAADAPANTPAVTVPSPLNDPDRVGQLLATLLDGTMTNTTVEMTPRININTAPKEVLMALTVLGTNTSSSTTTGTATAGTTAGTSGASSGTAGTGTGTTGTTTGAATTGGTATAGSATTGATTSGTASSGTTTAATGPVTEAMIDAIIAQRAEQDPTDPATLTGAWLVASGVVDPDAFKTIEKFITGRTMVYRVQAIGYLGQGGPVARVEAVIDTNRGAPRILYFRDLTDLDTPRGFEPPRP